MGGQTFGDLEWLNRVIYGRFLVKEAGVQCYDYEETIAILLKQLAKFSEPAQAAMACGIHKLYKRRCALTNIHFED